MTKSHGDGSSRSRSTNHRVIAALAFAGLVAGSSFALADETFILQATVTLSGVPLHSFDISWVDPDLGKYFLADRSNKRIDVIDTSSKTPSTLGANLFVGFTGNNDTSGPNGVLTIHRHGNGGTDVWAGDGDSTVKIIDFPSGNVDNVVSTGGTARADELCYDPKDHLVMIANDADSPPFVTFISTEGNNKILGKIKFPESTGGIEQCQWSPQTGKIYLNLPSTTDHPNGAVYVIDPRHETVENKFDAGAGCLPAGMALGPPPQILLGCGGPNAAVMDENTGALTTISAQGGSDEVWFNPGDGHYFLAEGNNTTQPQLGIVDSGNAAVDQDIKTGAGSHSVAADPQANQAYVPIRDTSSAAICPPPPVTTPPTPAQGCVAIFGPSSPDDHSVAVNRDNDHDRDND